MNDRLFHESAALPLRQNMANLVCEAVNQERRAVLLWLWDPEWRVYVLNRHAPRVEGDLFPAALRRRIVRSKQENADAMDPSAWLISIADHDALRGWAEGLGVSREEFFPVWRNEEERRIPLAFVHVLTGDPLDEESRRAVQQQLVGVGATIVRSRGERQLEAVARILQLQNSEPLDTGETAQQRWLVAAARTLASVTRARACAVFRPGERGQWESFVATGAIPRQVRFTAAAGGVVATAATTQQPIRAFDVLTNPTTREDAAMLAAVAQELAGNDAFSCLVMPVVSGQETLVVFLFVNKRAEFHLAEAFTVTDGEVVSLVAQLLAGVTPRFQLSEAVERAAGIGAPGALEDEQQRANLFTTMQSMLQQVVAAAVIHRARDEEPLTVRMLGGEQWFENADEVAQHTGGVETEGQISLAVPLHGVDGYLALLLRSALTSVDGQVLNAFRNEVSHTLHAETSIRAALDVAHQTQHALRAPLMAITGGLHNAYKRLDVCRQENLDAGQDVQLRNSLETARAEAQRLVEALNAPRFFLSDIQPNRLRSTRGSLMAVLENVCIALRPAAALRRIRIDLRGPAGAEAFFDRELLFNALFNIVDNAVKYASEDSLVGIDVRAGDGMWHITVENEGSSVAPEDRQRIFEAFVRKTERGKIRVPGTGLGLALARKVADAHSGTIRVESEGESGNARTRFVFSLRADASLHANASATVAAAQRQSVGRVRTIHHLDDEPGTVQWIGPALRDDISLRNRQWKPTEVLREGATSSFTVFKGDGELRVVHRLYSTADEFRDNFPQHAAAGDVVLVDVVTENANGALVNHGTDAYALAAKLLGEESVFFLTGYPRALLGGAVRVPDERVLSKPVDIDTFLKKISGCLEIES